MTKSNDRKSAQVARWSLRFLALGSSIAAFFATRISRLLILVIFIALALYIAYQQVWLPIVAIAPLPPGVADRNPQFNADLLKEINTQRQQRVEAPRATVSVDQLFRPITP